MNARVLSQKPALSKPSAIFLTHTSFVTPRNVAHQLAKACRIAPTDAAIQRADEDDVELRLSAEEQALLSLDEDPSLLADDEADEGLAQPPSGMEFVQEDTSSGDELEIDDETELYQAMDEEDIRALEAETFEDRSLGGGPTSTSYATYDEQDDKDSRDFGIAMARIASDTKGGDIVLLHVAPLVYWTSYMLVVTVFSRPQLNAVLARMENEASQTWKRVLPAHKKPGRGLWEVLDYGDVVVHVMAADERNFYDIESFYGAAEEVDLPFLQEAAAQGPQWKLKV